MHQAGSDIGCHADVALATAQHQRYSGRVVARIHRKALGHIADQPLGPLNIAGGFLDAHNTGYLRQPQHGVVGHIGNAATGHVVQHHRQVHRFRDGLEVLVLAFLRGFVVVGNDLQVAVGTHLARKSGEVYCLRGGVGTAARHHRHAAFCLFHRHADNLAMLLHADSGRFTRGPDHTDTVRPLRDVPVDQLAQSGVVHTAVFMHRRDKRHDAASNRCHSRSKKRESSILPSHLSR